MAAVTTLPKEVSKLGSAEVKLFGKWDTAECVLRPYIGSDKIGVLTCRDNLCASVL
ncbi:hypothetical protein EIP86_001337 [Pleurotus ostreatoroseus]|nr:hypothetical protein EIP86_001337 [Pleurotus ostreatoroseus]